MTAQAIDLRDAQALLVQACLDMQRPLEFMTAEAGPRQGELIMNAGDFTCGTDKPTYSRLGPMPGQSLDRWEMLVVTMTNTQVHRYHRDGMTARQIVDLAYDTIPAWAQPGYVSPHTS